MEGSLKLDRLRQTAIGAVSAFAMAFALTACGQEQGGEKKSVAGVFTIVIDGSSTVYPISESAGEAFQQEVKGRVRVTVAESGTGGGFRKFCRGETHVQNASRPITASEMAACASGGVRYIEIPIAFDALSVVVNPSNPVQSITTEELKRIWAPEAQGQITNWRQVNPSFPNLPLSLYGPGTASGTFDYFTEAVNGKAKASRTDYTPSEDDNVLVQGVSGDPGGLAYFGMAYYLENTSRVRSLGISHQGGAPVRPTPETVENGTYVPLARPVFIYVNAAQLERPPVAQFLNYYLTNGPALVRQAKYVPLPQVAYDTGLERIQRRAVGTAFGGHNDIGASIGEVLSRPLVLTPAT
jgi:phosphate transport system substrate-binding protein